MNITPKQLFITLVTIVSLVIMVGLVGFWMSHRALAGKADNLSVLMTDISVINERLTSLEQLEQEYAELADLRDSVYKILPEEKEQAKVALQLQAIVSSVGLELRGLSFESTSGRPGEISQTLTSSIPNVRIMPVRFQIVSSYQEFIQLLEALENNKRHMQISNLNISRSGSGLQFSINLEVFLKP